MRELKFNINYLFKRREFYIAIIIIFLINLIQVGLCVGETIRLNTFIEESYSAEYQFILYNAFITLNVLIIIVFPIVFSLIFADSNYIENKNKITNLLYIRLNYKRNIATRLLLSILVTFIISFLGFLFNYLLLRIIYGSGNRVEYFQSPAFYMNYSQKYFLDNIRIANPVLFTILINIAVSLILGLLSGLSYLTSFLLKHRIAIYFVPIIFLILSELLLPKIGYENLSFINLLQPFNQYSVKDYFIGTVTLVSINLLLFLKNIFKKDVLV